LGRWSAVITRTSADCTNNRSYALQRVRAKYAAAGRPATTKAALVARAIQDGIVNVEEI